jgi:hypothetical protein
MVKNVDALFQERVDELLLLEQRADRRAEKLIEITNDYQEKSQQALDDLLSKVNIGDSLARMNAASDQVRDYVAQSAQHALRTAQLFLGTVIACVLVAAGTWWWSNHIVTGLAQDRADLASLDTKLKHTPVIMHFKGKDYVRVVPDSETGFTRGDDSEVPGRYAEMWHVR